MFQLEPGQMRPIATLVLAAVAAGAVARLAFEAVAFDQATVGTDVPSTYERRFARARQLVPAGAIVGCLDDLTSNAVDDAVRRQAVAALAVALQRQLQTHRVEPGNRWYMLVLEELYRLAHGDAQQHDVATVTTNLVAMAVERAREQQLGNLRHALAPRVVNPRAAGEWLVGDFAPGFDYRELVAGRGLAVVADFGEGAVLFRAAR